MAKAAAKKRMVELSGGMVATKAAARGPVAVPEAPEGGAGQPLNFRVTPEFRRRFRQYALDHDMRLSAVLIEAFEALVREGGKS